MSARVQVPFMLESRAGLGLLTPCHYKGTRGPDTNALAPGDSGAARQREQAPVQLEEVVPAVLPVFQGCDERRREIPFVLVVARRRGERDGGDRIDVAGEGDAIPQQVAQPAVARLEARALG